MVQQMMIGISGYKEVEMIDSTPPIALVTSNIRVPNASHEIHPVPDKECYHSDQQTLGIKESIQNRKASVQSAKQTQKIYD